MSARQRFLYPLEARVRDAKVPGSSKNALPPSQTQEHLYRLAGATIQGMPQTGTVSPADCQQKMLLCWTITRKNRPAA